MCQSWKVLTVIFSFASMLCWRPSVNLLPSNTRPEKASIIATAPSFTIYSISGLNLGYEINNIQIKFVEKCIGKMVKI